MPLLCLRSRCVLSNKLVPVSRRELIRRLSRLGFVGPYPGADHEYMSRGLVDARIPNPHGSDIGVDLLQKILKRSGISREEWFEAA
ncbi:MAG: type II toxin-antitoxin system HicA family toxin [Methanothrix sp.]|nr:type II toxin-antitoxin system HicA family toxin [Methanothrix sp.]